MCIYAGDDIGMSLVEIMYLDQKSNNIGPGTLVVIFGTENTERISSELV